MVENDWSAQQLSEALRPLLLGRELYVWAPGDGTVLDVRAGSDDVLVTFRFMSYPHVLGFRLALVSEYTENSTSESPEEWASDAYTWLEEQLGTGLVNWGPGSSVMASSS